MLRKIMGLAVLSLAGCQQPAPMLASVAAEVVTAGPYEPIGRATSLNSDSYRGYYGGGNAQLTVTPKAGGMSNYTLVGASGPVRNCTFATDGSAPSNAQVIRFTSQEGGKIPLTMTRKSNGWSFHAEPQYNRPGCAFEGEVMP